MAAPDLTLIADIDLRQGRNKLNRQLRDIERRGIKIDTKQGVASLGRISSSANEFTKSLEASNARVIAFGASVAVIEGVRRSFTALVKTVVDVEKQLISINSILGRSTGGIQKFGNELFTIAAKTGQSFNQVAQTAQEFARQGLSVEQTLKRTKDALVLTRLTTLSTDEAVGALTASINGFEKQALTSTQVINKLRAVETSFAVSSDDLANALSRSASVAQDAGVSFDELLGLITAIKQRTGLGGATIGQGLKTAFTRLNLPTRIQQLKDLGVNIDESAGGLEKLRQVSVAVRKAQDDGNVSLATQIGAIAAGQFQISKLSAAFSDLSSQYSVADAAAKTSANATNEATKANDEYNQSVSAVANAIRQNVGAIFKGVGEAGLSDALKTALQDLNSFLQTIRGQDSGGSRGIIVDLINAVLKGAKEFGFLKDAAEGFINVLTGPGLIAGVAIIANLFKNTLTQGGSSLLQLTGINKKVHERVEIQKSLVSVISQATAEERKSLATSKTLEDQQRVILGIMERQLVIQKAQESQYLRTAEALRAQGISLSGQAGALTAKGLPRGRVGSFAGGVTDAIKREQLAINSGAGGATSRARPKVVSEFNYGNGKVGPAVLNSDEVLIPNRKGDIVLNRDMLRSAKSVESLAGGYYDKIEKLSASDAIRIQSKLNAGKNLTERQYRLIRDNSRLIRSNYPNLSEAIEGRGGVGRISPSSYNFGKSSDPFINRRPSGQSNNEGFNARGGSTPPVDGGRTTIDQAFTERNFQSQVDKFYSGQSVSSGVRGEIIKRNIDAEIESLRKETGNENLTRQEIKSKYPKRFREIARIAAKPVIEQQRAIRSALQQEALQKAQITLDREAKSGIRGKLGLNLGSAKNKALQTKGLNATSKQAIESDFQNRKFQRGQNLTQKAFLGSIIGSLAAPAIGNIAGSFFDDKEKGKRVDSAVSGTISGAASGLALGSFFGPQGAIAGAVIGGIGGLVTSLGETESAADKMREKAERLKEEFNDTRTGLTEYLKLQSNLNDLLGSNSLDPEKIKKVGEELDKVLFNLGDKELANKLRGSKTTEDQQRVVGEILEKRSKEAAAPVFAETILRINQKRGQKGLTKLFGNLLTTAEKYGQGTRPDLFNKFADKTFNEQFTDKDLEEITSVIRNTGDFSSFQGKSQDEIDSIIKKLVRTSKGFDEAEAKAFFEAFKIPQDVQDSLKTLFTDKGLPELARALLGTGLSLKEAAPKGSGRRALVSDSQRTIKDLSSFYGIDVGGPKESSIFAQARRKIPNKGGFTATQTEFQTGEAAIAQDFIKTVKEVAGATGGEAGKEILRNLENGIRETKGQTNIYQRISSILERIEGGVYSIPEDLKSILDQVNPSEQQKLDFGAARDEAFLVKGKTPKERALEESKKFSGGLGAGIGASLDQKEAEADRQKRLREKFNFDQKLKESQEKGKRVNDYISRGGVKPSEFYATAEGGNITSIPKSDSDFLRKIQAAPEIDRSVLNPIKIDPSVTRITDDKDFLRDSFKNQQTAESTIASGADAAKYWQEATEKVIAQLTDIDKSRRAGNEEGVVGRIETLNEFVVNVTGIGKEEATIENFKQVASDLINKRLDDFLATLKGKPRPPS